MPPRRLLSGLLPCVLLVSPAGAQPGDIDTQCAAAFTMLEDRARAAGVSDGSFGAMAVRAQQVYLAGHPGQEPARYAIDVISAAQELQQAVNNGTLAYPAIQAQVTTCNARYAAAPR